MIKVNFNEVENAPSFSLEVYNSISRVPFTLSIGNKVTRPTSVYFMISDGGNYIELWFDSNDKKLYEITLLTIKDSAVNKLQTILPDVEKGFYNCLLQSNFDSRKINLECPTQISKSDSALKISWSEEKHDVKYYSISNDCIVGVDGFFLIEIILTNLSPRDMLDIFGF